MKRKIYNVLMLCVAACVGLATTSCEDDFYSVSEPDFNVSLDKPVVRVGERAVFNFEGSADIISAYLGEEGNTYEYHDQARILPATMWMSFMMKTSSGTNGNPNPARVPLYYSTDFSGNYTLEDVKAATWVEISDRFKMPTDVGQQVSSGSVQINDLFDEKGKIYLALFYHLQAYDTAKANNGRTLWQVLNFMIEGKTDKESGVLYDGNNAGWQFVYEAGYDGCTGGYQTSCSLPDVNATRVLLRAEFKPSEDHKVWAISAPIEKQEDVNLGFDRPVAVKAYADPTMKSYYHIYNTPGEYDVTFIGVNANAGGRHEVVRQTTIKVVNDGGSISQPTPDEWK